jgi:hypothetical protein
VRPTAKRLDVGFIADAAAEPPPRIREIVFADTPDVRLYNNAFIPRRRVSDMDGFPVGDAEIVFKYRHPDLRTA